jgi:hypothetical protein
MASINLVESFQEFKDAENIDRPTLMKVMEDVFKTLIRKKYGSDENFDVIINDQKGDLEIFRRRTIVDDDDLYNTLTEIEYKDAIKIEPDYQVGEELYEEVDIQKEFGRRAILAGKQTLAARINDLKKNLLIKKYEDRVGDIVSGEVYQVWKKEVLILDEDGNEMILPKSEQIPSDYFNSVFEASNKIASAPLFVVYLVAYPFKFTVDAAISINLIFMSFIFTLFQLVSYLVSLGQTKLELYLTYATPNSLKSDNKEIALWLQIVTLVLMIVSLLSLIVMSLFIFYPEYIVVFIWPAINFIFIIPTVIMFNINLKPAKKVQKIVTT